MTGKIKDYLILTKFRLSVLVVISALTGYLFVGGDNEMEIFYLMMGGMLVTAASNAANQIWERDLDKLMNRTMKRPLADGRMSVLEALMVILICIVAGEILLFQLNFYSALLGFAAFLSYVFIYTPSKRITPLSVLIGAFPGAMPPMLGAIAETGHFGLIPGVLFFVQFTWQFPHFWAIAWVADKDYRAAGFSLLPSKFGKSKNSAYHIIVYSLALIPFSLLPWLLGWAGWVSMIAATVLGAWFFMLAYKLFLTLDDKDARKLMFASFFYLPIIQFIYVFDRIEVQILADL